MEDGVFSEKSDVVINSYYPNFTQIFFVICYGGILVSYNYEECSYSIVLGGVSILFGGNLFFWEGYPFHLRGSLSLVSISFMGESFISIHFILR